MRPLQPSSLGPRLAICERHTPQTVHCTVELDPRSAYLDHHRVGGRPLLGTVMGLELMLQAAQQLQPGAMPVRIETLRNGTACIVDEARSERQPVEVSAELQAQASLQSSYRCEVYSLDNAVKQSHFTANVFLADSPSQPFFTSMTFDRTPQPSVTSESIYRLFFHGPLFQVIANARCSDDRLIARSSLLDRRADYRSELRVLDMELCLQTAGLLELAQTGRMMIPLGIDAIQLCADMSKPPSAGAVAIATRSVSTPDAMDIELQDGTGRVLLQITNYRTCPAPFVSDVAAIDRLRNLLLATRSGR